ncbi:hypothetical protein D3C76_1226040 [compost metagenome]
MVGRCLAGGVGRARRVGRRFREQIIDTVQVAVNLVSGNVMKAEGAFLRFREGLPIGSGGFEQAVGADNVGLDEFRWPVDGTIDVGLRCQVHDRVRLKARQHCTDGRLIDNIGLNELVASVVGNAGQRLEIAGIRQFVQVEHFMLSVLNQLADKGRAYETGSAGNKDTHVGPAFFSNANSGSLQAQAGRCKRS